MLPNAPTCAVASPSDFVFMLHAAGSLANLGCDLLSNGEIGSNDQATVALDTAYAIVATPSSFTVDTLTTIVSKNVRIARTSLHREDHTTTSPPDLYQEGECDVGPRALRKPVAADFYTTYRRDLLGCVILYNKGLIYQSKGSLSEAKQMYELVSNILHEVLSCTTGVTSTSFMELAMRTFNNIGLIEYLEKKEGLATASFETAIHFAKQLYRSDDKYAIEYATTLSNWCRVTWMRGDISMLLYKNLQEILHVRSSALQWDHPDVAAARYNIAVAEFSRRECVLANAQFREYLSIAAHRAKEYTVDDLDPIPALIFLLLIEYEKKEDKMSLELVRGLRALQDKRQDEGADSAELAPVLNYVGALLFHIKDFENALLFFWEELRLEDKSAGLRMDLPADTTSVRVTCNNIGRILQELGRLHDAKHYYERALKADFGSVEEATRASLQATSRQLIEDSARTGLLGLAGSAVEMSAVNLYSTVWYNLGLIYDKLGYCDKAILAFEISHELREAMLGPNHPDVACLLYNIGVLQMETKQLSDASASFRKALRIRQIGAAGQLNDRHIIKTLERLAFLHEAKRSFPLAAEALSSVLSIQMVSKEFDDLSRWKEMGTTLRSLADMYEADDDLILATQAATECVRNLRMAKEYEDKTRGHDRSDRNSDLEQLASSLLLLGSLHHELCEPLIAEKLLAEAAAYSKQANSHAQRIDSQRPTSLYALEGVTSMLSLCHCAAKA